MKRNILILLLVFILFLETLWIRVTPVLFEQINCENVLFPMLCLRVTQGPNSTCSHPRQNAMDFAGTDKGCDDVYAPFSGSIKFIDNDYGAVWLESNRPVRYADGTIDYLTVMFLHDIDITDLWVGKTIRQGEIFYQEGGRGPRGANQYGNHVHIECMRGRVGEKGWDARGDLYCYNVFFIQTNTEDMKDGGYSWRTVGMPPKPGAAAMKASRPAYTVSDKVVLSWKATPNTTQYEIRLYCGGEPVRTIAGITQLNITLNLPVGNYTAKIRSVNSHFIEWNTEGSSVNFVVFEMPEIDQIIFDKPTPQLQNIQIRITTLATGAKYYKWEVYVKGSSKSVNKTAYNTSNQYIWEPEEPGQYIIRVYIKDYTGKEVYADSCIYEIDQALAEGVAMHAGGAE